MSPTPERLAEQWLRVYQANVAREIDRQALTYRELADRAGLRSHTTIHRWLHAKDSPTLTTVARVAHALRVTPLSLLTPQQERRP